VGEQLPHASRVRDFDRFLTWAVCRSGVDVRLDTVADGALVDRIAPEAVIVARARAAPRSYTLHEGGLVPHDLFTAPIGNPTSWSGRAVMVGGDAVSCAVALQLAHPALEITIVEPDDGLAVDRPPPGRAHLLRTLETSNIEVRLEPTFEAVGDGYVDLQARGIPDTIDQISYVITGGRSSENRLVDEVRAGGHPTVLTIGDAVRPRDLYSASLEGLRASALIGLLGRIGRAHSMETAAVDRRGNTPHSRRREARWTRPRSS